MHQAVIILLVLVLLVALVFALIGVIDLLRRKGNKDGQV